ncbi:WD repeat-containing protein 74-like isoform X2 [Pollicipes pollicipes]|uniref:WD repeat-containing protein 74-like isoform X2 n=1 Tax=Pollicipes pollicipes TaxID=41117 RepID=UPI001884D7C1|nr:WD repeat-containing protein 74-like isoform X2 [Pollicipes pollicipes]
MCMLVPRLEYLRVRPLQSGIQITESEVQTKNFHNLTALEQQNEICSMCWGDDDQHQLLLGLRSQQVKVYDTEQSAFTMCRQLSSGSGPVIGLAKHQGAVITAVESGAVTLWRFEESERVTIDALAIGESLCCMRQNPGQSNVLATGGKENDLQLWDLGRPEQPVFRAKNVRPDMLDLRVPVWVSDIAFMEDSRRVATCHRHSAVRLYDTASGQRRPVLSMTVGDDEPLTCMALTHRQHQVLVGSGRGRLELCDLRMGRSLQALKGLAGSVRSVVCHPQLPYAASVSLDRFLLVHDLDTRKLLHKVYLKSRLNCVLMRRDFSLVPQEGDAEAEPAADATDVAADEFEDEEDDLQIVEEFIVDEPPEPEAPKKKRKLPKLKVSGQEMEGSSPRKPKLPKLVTLSKKKKKKTKPREG